MSFGKFAKILFMDDCKYKPFLSKSEFQQIFFRYDVKICRLYEFIEKILEFHDKSLSFWHFLEFFRP